LIINRVALLSPFARVKPALLTSALFLVLSACPATANDDLRSLELYNGVDTDIVSGNRSPRPASQTAENITVVTSNEIEALNAHTLADILYSVTGVQLEMNRTPGTAANLEILGSNFNHVLVLIDNVPINNLSDNYADISSVTAQMIERIEIVKGAASTSWGSALGGVINVITKSPREERPFGGLVSASLGTRETADLRGEASGTLNRLGYYLTGGRLRSDGLLPNNRSDLNTFYGKLQYDLPVHGFLSLTTGLTEGSSGQLAFQNFNFDQENRQRISTLAMQYPLANHFIIDASLRSRESTSRLFMRNAPDSSILQQFTGEDTDNGASLKVSWLGEMQRVVAGVDYDHVRSRISAPQLQADELTRRADRVGLYLNDTITIGAFAITPSARFDRTDSGGNHFSPSLGITYALTENSVLRGYTARGYSLTSLNRTGSTEKVWTSQVGVESGEIPYLWLKGTLFRNDTWDVTVDGPDGIVQQRQLKQGVEFEARTSPFFNTSLSAGYTFISASEGESGPVIHGVPRHTANIGVRYRYPDDFHADLTGHYINWNNGGAGRYGTVLWDLHLRKELEYSENLSLELFLSIRNILNGDQYRDDVYQNTGRWGEAGVRCNF